VAAQKAGPIVKQAAPVLIKKAAPVVKQAAPVMVKKAAPAPVRHVPTKREIIVRAAAPMVCGVANECGKRDSSWEGQECKWGCCLVIECVCVCVYSYVCVAHLDVLCSLHVCNF
jgi:hypothetical protein